MAPQSKGMKYSSEAGGQRPPCPPGKVEVYIKDTHRPRQNYVLEQHTFAGLHTAYLGNRQPSTCSEICA